MPNTVKQHSTTWTERKRVSLFLVFGCQRKIIKKKEKRAKKKGSGWKDVTYKHDEAANSHTHTHTGQVMCTTP